MTNLQPKPITGSLPRRLSQDFMWAGSCLDVAYAGRRMHSHFGVYLVRTAAGVYMIDTGHPTAADVVAAELDSFLAPGEQVRWIIPTHAEVPHAGLLGRWLAKFPQSVVIGDVRDYKLFYPEEWTAGRFVSARPGDALDLGDRQLLFVPAVWHDLPNSLWMFDSLHRALFVADGFAFLHPHGLGECDLLSAEQAEPDLEMAKWFNSAALFWTRFGDVPGTFADMDELLERLDPQVLAPAHGAVINRPDMVAFFKRSMLVRPDDYLGK